MTLPRWIFFDCCRTLLCVDNVSEYWIRMAPIPVQAGSCSSEQAFNRAYAAWQKWRRQQASTNPYPENPLPQGLSQILVGLNPSISQAEVEMTVGKMVEVFYANYLSRTRPAPGVRQMVDAWQGIAKMGMVSDFFLRDCPRRLLAEFGLDGHFEFILDSAAVGFRKPAKEIYLEALRQARLAQDQAVQVLYVGDNLTLDVITPANLGMQAVHYNPGRKGQVLEEKSCSYPSIAHWDEFRPDWVVEQEGS